MGNPTVDTAPSYRQAFKKRRCQFLAEMWFYEQNGMITRFQVLGTVERGIGVATGEVIKQEIKSAQR